MAPVCFHLCVGSMVTLSNGNRTAQRNHPHQEFNNGLIMSSEPLRDNQLFEVRIDRKIYAWSGSVEIGVTTLDPDVTCSALPSSATNLRDGSWVMSGTSVLHDGRAILEEYGTDLDQLQEGDRVGVMRSSGAELHFFVNGVNQGVAATNIPNDVYAVVDMYGKCAQVSLMDSTEARIMANDISNENLAAAYMQSSQQTSTSGVQVAPSITQPTIANEKLAFHERCGSLITLSNGNETAERRRPSDEFNNGVVMTNRPLRENEMFQISIDELVNKWSGSIEMGVTTHNPSTLEFPATMTNMRSNGACTIMMSGSGILTNGKGTRREYGEFNLDELHEGDTIGLSKLSNGNLHYYINGMDQGVAATGLPSTLYGVVDLYGMTVKVTIVNGAQQQEALSPDTSNDNMIDSLNSALGDISIEDSEKLSFHHRCGCHAAVINAGKTAHRPKALDDFNNAVLLTSRPLRVNEMFEVLIERLVVKWAGSIEIGVTTHLPTQLEFPSTMTNMRTGTWMMTGNGVMYNGITIIDQYGHSLDRLNVGDRVGVIRLPNSSIKFFVNGVDQGVAATNIPDQVYGVIDLYGQAAQATIVDHSSLANGGGHVTNGGHMTPLSGHPSSNSLTLGGVNGCGGSDLRFHPTHGKNARILNRGLTAVRPNAHGEFNDAILISSRPLKDDEMFEIVIEQMVDRWSGSIEAGVTAISPEKLDLPSTMTDLDHDSWMLSGSAVMQDGATVRNGYKCDLDHLRVGTRIGMMRQSDATLHYFINGEDQGVACTDIPTGVYAVIDLYGQCAQVSIVQTSQYPTSSSDSSALSPESLYVNVPFPISNEVGHKFHSCCGKNIVLRNNSSTACRVRGYTNSLLFSALPLGTEEIFQIQLDHLYKNWAGCLQLGLTTYIPLTSGQGQQSPQCIADLVEASSSDIWLVSSNQVTKNGHVIKCNVGPSLERLCVGDRVGLKRSVDGNMHVLINGEDLGPMAPDIPKRPHVVIDLFGRTGTVSICSLIANTITTTSTPSNTSNNIAEELEAASKESISYDFHDSIRGKNIQYLNGQCVARRMSSYNQGLVVTNKPLVKGKTFQIRIDKLDPRWNSSLQLGILCGQPPTPDKLPHSAMGFRSSQSAWVISGDSVFHSGGVKVQHRYGPNLDSLTIGHVIGLTLDTDNQLRLSINDIDQGVAVKNVTSVGQCYAFVDLYGQCEQVTIINEHHVTCAQAPTIEGGGEKADKENSVTEKITKADHPLVRNCEYMNSCARFRALLGFPENYFQSDCAFCYCETCHKIRGDEPYYKKGDPPKDYALPFGWCRFVLRLPSKAENSSVQDKWHVAFHGTKVGAVRRILDHGELLPTSQMGLGPFAKDIRKSGKDKDLESCQICISPTLKYAGSSVFAPRQEFVDPKMKKQIQARVAFQVYIRPGSYTVGPPHSGTCSSSRDPIDVHFNNSDLEWHTKERGATILHSLLVKLEQL